jgi:hypothetical protein
MGIGDAIGVNGIAHGQGAHGVWGESDLWEGVHGVSHGNAAGVAGFNDAAPGSPGQGVWGESQNGDGVNGIAHGQNAHGVWGESDLWEGVHGVSHGNAAGVAGFNDATGQGVWGESQNGDGVTGTAHGTGAGIHGVGGRGPAGYFDGNVLVTGDVVLINSNGDVAEDFDVADGVCPEPGTVLIIGPDGKLRDCTDAYDTRVAGVIAGAGNFKPAIVLQRIKSPNIRYPVALVGKAFCKVDAACASIQPGDLLTTSATRGHAMKLIDRSRAAGAILGKALGGLHRGEGLIPVLLTAC